MYKKVLCPITLKDGRTIWRRTGSAFDNKDGSINVFLDVLPTNGKLQIRELNELDRERIEKRDHNDNPANDGLPF